MKALRDAITGITGISLIAGFASTIGWPLSKLMAQQQAKSAHAFKSLIQIIALLTRSRQDHQVLEKEHHET